MTNKSCKVIGQLERTCKLTGLDAYKRYNVIARERTKIGWGPYSDVISFQTREGGQCLCYFSYTYILIVVMLTGTHLCTLHKAGSIS